MGSLQECSSRMRFILLLLYWDLCVCVCVCIWKIKNFMSVGWDWDWDWNSRGGEKMTDLDLRGMGVSL